MENQPLISVITVTFNAEDVIAKTMKSISDQNFKDFEHVIIDGKSVDNTLSIINENKTLNTQIISEPDKGLYDAMNKGLLQAMGKYVIFLNAGDTFHDKDTLAKYAVEALKNKDIVYGDTIIVDSDGNKISDRHLKTPEVLNKSSFSKGMLVCHQAFMVKKNLAPSYDIHYKFSADFDWCIKCIENSDTTKNHNLNTITIDYLQNGLTDKNKIKSLKERFNIMRVHYGTLITIYNHLGFIFRALKRGNL